MNIVSNVIDFELPVSLACPRPTELRNIERDDVRLLVTKGNGSIEHTVFNQLAEHLQAGDVLVVNKSATRVSAFPIDLPGGSRGMVHFSTPVRHGDWLVEIREIVGDKTVRWKDGEEGIKFDLPGRAGIKLKGKYYENRDLLHLWVVEFRINGNLESYMARYGQPIKYEKLSESYPLDYYQTFFSFHPGSSEMPSAGRGFTQNLVTKLLQKGIVFAPILLHTGVSSLEENEPPYPEYMELSPVSALIINNANQQGKRVIAVGTTAVRAVESAVNQAGEVAAYMGNTDLFITDDYRMKATSGLLTGFHEPRASHLNMLQSLAGFEYIGKAYAAAIENNYYWHQFGDLHLILP